MLSKFHKCCKRCVLLAMAINSTYCRLHVLSDHAQNRCMLALVAALSSIMQIGCTFNACRVCALDTLHMK